MGYFEQSAAKIVSAEMRFHLRCVTKKYDLGRYHSRKKPGSIESLETTYSDLERLRALPGGSVEVLKILTLLCPIQIKMAGNTNHGFENKLDVGGGPVDVEGVYVLRELFRLSPDDRRAWDISATFEAMTGERKKQAEDSDFPDDERQKYRRLKEKEEDRRRRLYKVCPVWERSLELLQSWHSRETATMLAMKVSGQLLPPELVELITEYLDDESAGIDHSKRGPQRKWWMDPKGKMKPPKARRGGLSS